MSLTVVGAGLGRTGTMSLKLALEQLGLGPCYHMIEVFKNPAAPIWWEAAADGTPDWPRIFDGYRSTVDWPSATFWRELADAYPESRLILTVRDAQAWYASTQATIFARDYAAPPANPFDSMVHKVIGRMFDMDLRDRTHVISVFERHNAEVVAAIPPERLLVWDVAEGWGPLCAFLGVDVPQTPMPKANSTEEFLARMPAAAARIGASVGDGPVIAPG